MKLNKDFYSDLPSMVPPMLERLITQYRNEPWFEKAWNEYRQHVINSNMDEVKMPGFVFNKYTKELKHSVSIPEGKIFKMVNSNYELYHHGILGMKWGVRRFQNPDGSLTAEGKIRYRYDEKKGKYVKRSGSEVRKLRKEAKKKAAAAAAKKIRSPREKKITEMTDKQLEKYIKRMQLEKQAIGLRNDVNNMDPKPLTKGQQFVKKYIDGMLLPHLQQNGSKYLDALVKYAEKQQKNKDGEDKYAVAKKEAEYMKNKKNYEVDKNQYLAKKAENEAKERETNNSKGSDKGKNNNNSSNNTQNTQSNTQKPNEEKPKENSHSDNYREPTPNKARAEQGQKWGTRSGPDVVDAEFTVRNSEAVNSFVNEYYDIPWKLLTYNG